MQNQVIQGFYRTKPTMYFRLDNCPLTGHYFKPCACMHTAHHICLILCVFLLDTSVYLKAYGEVFWLQLFTSMAWNWWVLKVANLQSRVKSEFCTLSPTECLSCGFGTAMSPALIPPWLMLFTGGQKWSSHTLTLFSWGKGEVFVVSRVHCWPQVFQLNYCHKLFT